MFVLTLVCSSKLLEAEYNEKKRIKDSLETASTDAFSRRKTIATEMKQYREQLDEARHYEQLEEEKVRAPFLWFTLCFLALVFCLFFLAWY